MELSLLDKMLIKIINDKLHKELLTIFEKNFPKYLIDNGLHSAWLKLYEENDYPKSLLINIQKTDAYKFDNTISIHANYKVLREIFGELYGESLCECIDGEYLKRHNSTTLSEDASNLFIATVVDQEAMNTVCTSHKIDRRKFGLIGTRVYYYSSALHNYNCEILRISYNPSLSKSMSYIVPNSICNAKLKNKDSNLIFQTLCCIYKKYFEHFDASKWKITVKD